MTDHATRAREICTIGEHDGFACLFIGGLPMYHAGTVEQIGHQMDRLLPIIAAALTRAAEEAGAELGDLRLRLNCPMVAPSCLVCGQQKELVIKHLEASAIGVCEVCRTAAQATEEAVQAAQPVYSKDKPTVAGGYWVRRAGLAQVMNVRKIDGYGLTVGPYFKPLEECDGWEFAGPLPMPKEA